MVVVENYAVRLVDFVDAILISADQGANQTWANVERYLGFVILVMTAMTAVPWTISVAVAQHTAFKSAI